MKRISLIAAFVFLLCGACNMKTSRAEEEDAYNPYDTSELENTGSMSDTLYSRDSVTKSYKLNELNPKDTKN